MKRIWIVVIAAVVVSGCDSRGQSSLPAAPTPTSPPAVAPVVTAISPTVGSTDGGTEVKITGAGLGTQVMVGGVTVQARFDSRYPGGLLLFSTPAYAAGVVDVVIGGQNGQSVTLSNAFTFALPQTFDFNGGWSGFGRNGQDYPIRFTVLNNMLLSVSCDSFTSDPDAIVTFAPPLPVTNSAFAFNGDGVTFTGRIVSPSNATGTIRLGECASDSWYAVKQ